MKWKALFQVPGRLSEKPDTQGKLKVIAVEIEYKQQRQGNSST